MAPEPKTYTANVRVRDLPVHVNNMLDAIATAQGRPKWAVVRDALIEYAEKHRIGG